MWNTILNYLKQTSTYTGIVTLLGVFGLTVSDALIQAFATFCIALVGLIEVIRNEHLKENNQNKEQKNV